MTKRFLVSLIAGSIALGSGIASAIMPVQAQDFGERTVIYMYSPDYPPAGVVQHPRPATRETTFWQMLDKAMAGTPALALTESLDDAEYRVELKCGGITHCSKLKVYIETPNRDVLSSFTMRKTKPLFFPPSEITLEDVANRLAVKLQEHIDALAEGGFGYH